MNDYLLALERIKRGQFYDDLYKICHEDLDAICADIGVHLDGDTKQRKEKNVAEDDEFEKYIAESIENDICNDPEFEQRFNKVFSTNVKE